MPQEGLRSSIPLVRLSRFARGALVFAKGEHLHPTGSLFDRIAPAAFNKYGSDLERAGVGVVGGSGSLSLAFAAAHAAWRASDPKIRKGVRLLVVCPESTLLEHRILLEKHGVSLVFSDGARGFAGINEVAHREVERSKGVLLYAPSRNEDARRIYRETIGAELVRAIGDSAELRTTDAVVVPYGSGALLHGLGDALTDAQIAVALIGTVAAKSNGSTRQDGVVRDGDVRHVERGIELHPVRDEDAFSTRMELARTEGILVGLSSAAAVHIAASRARRSTDRAQIAVTIDCGDRYFSVDHHFRASAEAVA
jgi:cysteine synthase A